jgi:hypothetical protein
MATTTSQIVDKSSTYASKGQKLTTFRRKVVKPFKFSVFSITMAVREK